MKITHKKYNARNREIINTSNKKKYSLKKYRKRNINKQYALFGGSGSSFEKYKLDIYNLEIINLGKKTEFSALQGNFIFYDEEKNLSLYKPFDYIYLCSVSRKQDSGNPGIIHVFVNIVKQLDQLDQLDQPDLFFKAFVRFEPVKFMNEECSKEINLTKYCDQKYETYCFPKPDFLALERLIFKKGDEPFDEEVGKSFPKWKSLPIEFKKTTSFKKLFEDKYNKYFNTISKLQSFKISTGKPESESEPITCVVFDFDKTLTDNRKCGESGELTDFYKEINLDLIIRCLNILKKSDLKLYILTRCTKVGLNLETIFEKIFNKNIIYAGEYSNLIEKEIPETNDVDDDYDKLVNLLKLIDKDITEGKIKVFEKVETDANQTDSDPLKKAKKDELYWSLIKLACLKGIVKKEGISPEQILFIDDNKLNARVAFMNDFNTVTKTRQDDGIDAGDGVLMTIKGLMEFKVLEPIKSKIVNIKLDVNIVKYNCRKKYNENIINLITKKTSKEIQEDINFEEKISKFILKFKGISIERESLSTLIKKTNYSSNKLEPIIEIMKSIKNNMNTIKVKPLQPNISSNEMIQQLKFEKQKSEQKEKKAEAKAKADAKAAKAKAKADATAAKAKAKADATAEAVTTNPAAAEAVTTNPAAAEAVTTNPAA